MNLEVKFLKDIEECAGVKFHLPNGIGVFANGNIVVVDGANNRICLLGPEGNFLKTVGKLGFGQYNFKEPVGVSVSPDQKIYVADWHNHRVVVYRDDLTYEHEFGHFGGLEKYDTFLSKTKQILGFVKRMAYRGSYIPKHFGKKESIRTHQNYSFRQFFSAARYWYALNGSSAKTAVGAVLSNQDAMDKPNGVAFHRDRVVVSQKNAGCLSVYQSKQPEYVHLRNYYGPSETVKYGRLCNVTYHAGFFYLCDEWNHIIWKLSETFQGVDEIIGENSGSEEFLPFSCCPLHQNLLAVAGGLNFQIINEVAKKVVYRSGQMGELHGLAYERKTGRLYIVNRSEGKIHVFHVRVS